MSCNSTQFFQKVFDLEGNLSSSQHLRLREQTIQSGGGFETYIWFMQQELNGVASPQPFNIIVTQNPSSGQLYIVSSTKLEIRIPKNNVPDFCIASQMWACDTYHGSQAEKIWTIAQEYEG